MRSKPTTLRKRVAKIQEGSTGTPTRNSPVMAKTKAPKWVLHELWLEQHGEEYRAALFRNIKERLPGLEALKAQADAQWPPDQVHSCDSRYLEVCEVYYRLQPLTMGISKGLQELIP